MPGSPRRDLDSGLRALARGGELEVAVHGDCMAPLLADGARVEVAPARLYWPGDVIVFRAEDGLLRAHRLLGYRRVGGLVRGRFLGVTCGDADPGRDAPVPLSRVLGRVRRSADGTPLSPPAARLAAVAAFVGLAFRHLLRR